MISGVDSLVPLTHLAQPASHDPSSNPQFVLHIYESLLFCPALFFFFNVFFLREGERQRVGGEGTERKGDTESEAGSRLWAVSTEPDTGLEPTKQEIMT